MAEVLTVDTVFIMYHIFDTVKSNNNMSHFHLNLLEFLLEERLLQLICQILFESEMCRIINNIIIRRYLYIAVICIIVSTSHCVPGEHDRL